MDVSPLSGDGTLSAIDLRQKRMEQRSDPTESELLSLAVVKVNTLRSRNCVSVLMRDEERSKQGQTNNKAKQHSRPKAVAFPKLPRVGLEPTTHVYVTQMNPVKLSCTYIHVYT